MKISASFTRNGKTIRIRWYDTEERYSSRRDSCSLGVDENLRKCLVSSDAMLKRQKFPSGNIGIVLLAWEPLSSDSSNCRRPAKGGYPSRWRLIEKFCQSGQLRAREQARQC